MLKILRKIYAILSISERKQLLVLSFAVICVATIEVAGIASIMPFMTVVANPNMVEKNQYLHWAYEILEFNSVDNFLIFLGLSVFIVMLVSNGAKALVLWVELKFIHDSLYNLSRRLLDKYINQPYVFFLNQNTSELGKNILQEVAQFTQNVLRPCTQILTRIVVVTFILGLLVVVDPVLAVCIAAVLGGAYMLLYILVQQKLARLGKERFEANTQRFRTAAEIFGGIKELKVLRREEVFLDQFSVCARKMEDNRVKSGVISQMPSYVMEVLAFGGILMIVIYFLVKQNMGQSLPVMSLYAFAAYRLMPSLQQIFSSLTQLRFNLPALEVIHRDLSSADMVPAGWREESVPALLFQKTIQLSSVLFRYSGAAKPVISGLDLSIHKNSSIGLVGGTGSGKTTTVDIILGLFTPQAGCLSVDGVRVNAENLGQWQRLLGYVPQSIFLSDNTLASNIAFGVAEEKIDMGAVERAARIANIHDFIVNELPNGYATHVGERGVRLSGGQRQRIGIARALYHDPEVLIMDEATSALDGVTEEAVIQAIRSLAGKKTIITIAHRLTTLRDCDVIYVMEQGKIVEQGSYEELSITSSRFLAMARTGTS